MKDIRYLTLVQLRKWIRIYDSLGETGLEHGKPTLDINQRLDLIRRVEDGLWW